MVYLDRIYTKSGDAGETSLGDGTRVPKTALRVETYGIVDELNAALGVVLALGTCADRMKQRLLVVQNDLFDLGADLCVPESKEGENSSRLAVRSEQVQQLETWIDDETSALTPLRSFILPGGTPVAALFHQARVVCRRAEIAVCRLKEQESINDEVLKYLNRLSDLLFVMARMANNGGNDDVLWVPGGQRSAD
ncbi:MAG: cob(I)yrinic acid a,c-diamide adenosyltransferase [Planctomycetaceae bacterium]|nr:cob(I)yrinic acid a,c-diamide adenosyltransferase [Planctomycetaceae bacterium]MCB9953136.1 cob(I)yrinic acid a,c-diamide adenosyltransferase [Planctomycetaceae bacterium]